MISKKLRNLRKNFNISQVDLAAKLGVTKQCVSNWENDNILPSIEMLVKIAQYFNTSTDFLLGLNNNKTLDVSELSDEEIAHLKLLIKDITKAKNRIY